MAKFSMNEADNYGVSNQGSFFTLKDDGDTARVRFLYETADDVEGYSVHTVKIGDKDRYVNCLRTYNEPIDNCPLCKAGNKIKPRLFVKLYNEDAGECQLWERGKTFFDTLSGLSNRYNPLYNKVIEIERHGKKGDMQTTYQTYPCDDSEPVNIDDFECPEPLGFTVMDKTFEEMETFIRTGDFGDDESGKVAETRTQSRSEDGVRRRSSRAF